MLGEEEFEVIQGDQIFIPQGMRHFVRNDGDVPFHFYTIWWNAEGVSSFQARRAIEHAQA